MEEAPAGGEGKENGMSEEILAGCVSPGTIAQNIRYIVRQTQMLVLRSAVEIGEQLVQAKALVEPGEWCRYVENEVGFSQSTANNYMKLYKELGQGQRSLFSGPGLEELGDLPYTKVLKLLMVPEEERDAFLEQNDVAAMSTRELDAAIRERDAAQKALIEARQDLNDAAARATMAERGQQNAEEEAEGLAEKLRQAKGQLEDAARGAKEKEGIVQGLKKQLRDARKEAQEAREELANHQGATVSEEQMAQLRAEAAKDAELAAEERLREAKKKAEQAAEEAEALRKEVARLSAEGQAGGDIRVVEFRGRLSRCQDDIFWLVETMEDMAAEGCPEAKGMNEALRGLVDNVAESLGYVPGIGEMYEEK